MIISGDSDQALHSGASDVGLHCLPNTVLGISRLQWDLIHLADFQLLFYKGDSFCGFLFAFIWGTLQGNFNKYSEYMFLWRNKNYLLEYYVNRICPYQGPKL